MRGGLFVLLACALSAQTQPDPMVVLAEARGKIVASRPNLPNYTCTQTVNRSYFKRPTVPLPFPSCSQIRAERDSRNYPLGLYLTDRLRLDVKVSAGVEIGSWAGASQFDEKNIFDLVGKGPFGTGALGTFLSDIFDNEGTRFAYDGPALSDADELYQYSFQLPLSASHYFVHVGKNWQVVAYGGQVGVDPRTLAFKRLVVHAADLPAEAEVCEVTTVADYTMVHFSRGDFLLPLQSRLHIVASSTAEDEIRTTYAGCREYQSESTISFSDASSVAPKSEKPARVDLPAGLPVSLALKEPINTEVAAAGDLVLASVRKAVRAKGSKEVLIPAGATVRGRIIRMQHWMQNPPRFDIAIRLENWEADGTTSPLHAQPDRAAESIDPSSPKRSIPLKINPAGLPPGARIYSIPTNTQSSVLPRGFESEWITTEAPAR